jgi:hypothetical protein
MYDKADREGRVTLPHFSGDLEAVLQEIKDDHESGVGIM